MGKKILLLLAVLIAVAASTCIAQQWTTINPTVIATGPFSSIKGEILGTWEVFAGYEKFIWLWQGNTVTKLTPCSSTLGNYNWLQYAYYDVAHPMNSQWWVPLRSGRAITTSDPVTAHLSWIAFTIEAQLIGPPNTGNWVSATYPYEVTYGLMTNANGRGDFYLVKDALNLLYSGCPPVLSSGSATVQRQTQQLYTCSKCGETFTDLNAYKRHIAEC